MAASGAPGYHSMGGPTAFMSPPLESCTCGSGYGAGPHTPGCALSERVPRLSETMPEWMRPDEPVQEFVEWIQPDPLPRGYRPEAVPLVPPLGYPSLVVLIVLALLAILVSTAEWFWRESW